MIFFILGYCIVLFLITLSFCFLNYKKIQEVIKNEDKKLKYFHFQLLHLKEYVQSHVRTSELNNVKALNMLSDKLNDVKITQDHSIDFNQKKWNDLTSKYDDFLTYNNLYSDFCNTNVENEYCKNHMLYKDSCKHNNCSNQIIP